jgi:hypothetical protein
MNLVITGVWFSNSPKHSRNISHVMIHEFQNNIISRGQKKDVASVISLINGGKHVFTATWNYKTTGWDIGSNVSIEYVGLNKYIRTMPNKIIDDNLDNLIEMNAFL